MGSVRHQAIRERVRKKKEKIIKPDRELGPKLAALREMVENMNKRPDIAQRAGGIYRCLDPEAVYTTKSSGFEIGYKLEDMGLIMRRKVFLKCLEARMNEIPYGQLAPIVVAVLAIMTDQQQGKVIQKQIAEDCYLYQQDFCVEMQVELNPRLRSIAGGFDA